MKVLYAAIFVFFTMSGPTFANELRLKLLCVGSDNDEMIINIVEGCGGKYNKFISGRNLPGPMFPCEKNIVIGWPVTVIDRNIIRGEYNGKISGPSSIEISRLTGRMVVDPPHLENNDWVYSCRKVSDVKPKF